MKRNGFTLIELLAATVVMSMLLAALVGISNAASRQARRAKEIQSRFPSASLVEAQITRDIRNADGMQNLSNGVMLFGAIGSDPTGQPTQQLAQVTYQIQNVRGLRVLLRIEQQGKGAGHRRIVWIGATAFSVSPIGMSIGQPPDARRTGGLSPMPTSVDVQLIGADGDSVFSSRVRHHREMP